MVYAYSLNIRGADEEVQSSPVHHSQTLSPNQAKPNQDFIDLPSQLKQNSVCLVLGNLVLPVVLVLVLPHKHVWIVFLNHCLLYLLKKNLSTEPQALTG